MDDNQESDDKMYLLIVEERHKGIEEKDLAVKQEPIDDLKVEDVLQRIKILGEYIEFDESIQYSKKVKQEVSHTDYQNNQCTNGEYIEFDESIQYCKKVKHEVGHIDYQNDLCTDGEYIDLDESIQYSERVKHEAGHIDYQNNQCTDEEYIEFDESTQCSEKVKEEVSHVNYQSNQCTDDEFKNELHSDDDEKNTIYTKRTQNLFPEDQYSAIEELRNQIPQLYENQDALISNLVLKMRAVARPPLPVPYYRLTQENKYECIKCSRVTDSEPASGRHYAEYHGPRYLKCFACGADFRSNTNLYKHEKRCVAPDAALVLVARAMYLGRKGRSRPFLQKHRTFKHGTLDCLLCSAKFRCRPALEAHERLHRGERPYQCDQCPRAYTSYPAFTRHLSTHSDTKFECDHCGRSFKYRTTITTHLRTHEEKKPFPCLQCPRRFSTNFALRLHVRREHLKLPPPCACKLCPRRYPRMSLLSAHMKQAHGVTLITRNMFLKRLPLLSNMELEKAKVILNNEVEWQSGT